MRAFAHASHHKDVRRFFSDEREFVSQRVWQGKTLGDTTALLQEHVASGNVVLLKVHRDLNPADDLTHFWCKADGIKHFSKMSLQATSQRSSLAEGRCENSRQERIKNEHAVCASLLESARPVAMTRIQWADQTGQGERVLANETVRSRSSLQFHV